MQSNSSNAKNCCNLAILFFTMLLAIMGFGMIIPHLALLYNRIRGWWQLYRSFGGDLCHHAIHLLTDLGRRIGSVANLS
jgi:hypothetical protein